VDSLTCAGRARALHGNTEPRHRGGLHPGAPVDNAMSWFTNNLALFSTLASVATLVVWVFYAQLLYLTFRRNERPLLLIHQAQSGNVSFCLVANLTRRPVHVVAVDLTLHTHEGHEINLRLNQYQRITNREESDFAVETVMKEGPLGSGDYLALGGFKSMLDATRTDHGRDDEARFQQNQRVAERTREVEIRVSALFSAFDNPIGAVRRFTVTSQGEAEEVRLDPVTPVTRQLSSFRQRRRLMKWLQGRGKPTKRRWQLKRARARG
jgi:hypothetical protein